MTAPITDTKKLNIIKLHIFKKSQRFIETKTGISRPTVSKTISEFEQGIMPGFEDIRDRLYGFNELSGALNKSGHTLSEAIVGAMLLNRFLKIGIKPDKFNEIVIIHEKKRPLEFSMDDYLDAVIKLHKLEEEKDLPYQQLMEKYEHTLTVMEESEQKLNQLNEDIEKSKKELIENRNNFKKNEQELDEKLAQKLSKNAETLDNINMVVELQEKLKGRGLNLKNLQELEDFFNICDGEFGYNTSKIIEMGNLSKVVQENDIAAKDVSRFIKMHGILKKLGVTEETITGLAKEIPKLGLSPKEGITIVSAHIKEFGNIKNARKSFDREKREMKAELETLQCEIIPKTQEKRTLEDTISSLVERKDSIKEQLFTKKQELGYLTSTSADINKILRRKNELEKENQRLEEEKVSLEEENQRLKKEKDLIEKSWDELSKAHDEILDELGTLIGTKANIQEILKEISVKENELQGIKDENYRLIEDSRKKKRECRKEISRILRCKSHAEGITKKLEQSHEEYKELKKNIDEKRYELITIKTEFDLIKKDIDMTEAFIAFLSSSEIKSYEKLQLISKFEDLIKVWKGEKEDTGTFRRPSESARKYLFERFKEGILLRTDFVSKWNLENAERRIAELEKLKKIMVYKDNYDRLYENNQELINKVEECKGIKKEWEALRNFAKDPKKFTKEQEEIVSSYYVEAVAQGIQTAKSPFSFSGELKLLCRKCSRSTSVDLPASDLLKKEKIIQIECGFCHHINSYSTLIISMFAYGILLPISIKEYHILIKQESTPKPSEEKKDD